jgi:AraC family transcriptional activator of tynA and feaB
MMLQRGDFSGTPQLDYEAWIALASSKWGQKPQVIEPNAFAGWIRTLRVYGLTASASKIQCGFAATDLLHQAYQYEHQNLRLAGDDSYYTVFQLSGQSAVTQNDQTVQLAVGDVGLFEAARPARCFANSSQWLIFHLPRQSLVSHLGLEPQGGLCGHGGSRAGRLLYQLVLDGTEDADTLSASASAHMQLAFYDLLGAVLAPTDPIPVPLSTDKLFKRICGIIKDNFADPDLGPGEVAAAAGISLRYLHKLFTARGLTCAGFIFAVRLDHAAHLLRRRELLRTCQPISEIAYACGFADHTHFARKFRRQFGHTPGSYSKTAVVPVT